MSESKFNTIATEQQKKFAIEIVAGKKPMEAFRAAYPDTSEEYVRKKTYAVFHNPRVQNLIKELQEQARAKFIEMLPEAIERLLVLAKTADSEKVRLEANKEIIHQGGLIPPQRVEVETTPVFGGAELESLRDELRQRLDEWKPKPKTEEEKKE